MRIEVTESDIVHGARWDCDNCPIALAIERATHQANCWSVLWNRATSPLGTVWLPDEAKDFIDNFDNERPVAPFSFDVDLPEPT